MTKDTGFKLPAGHTIEWRAKEGGQSAKEWVIHTMTSCHGRAELFKQLIVRVPRETYQELEENLDQLKKVRGDVSGQVKVILGFLIPIAVAWVVIPRMISALPEIDGFIIITLVVAVCIASMVWNLVWIVKKSWSQQQTKMKKLKENRTALVRSYLPSADATFSIGKVDQKHCLILPEEKT